jgi:hypothetical protein
MIYMKKLAGNIILLLFLSCALGYNVLLPKLCNSLQEINSEFSFQEVHNLAGDLALNEHNSTNPVVHHYYKNLSAHLLTGVVAGNFNYNLKVKSAEGFLLLKKHLAFIYVYHNFW